MVKNFQGIFSVLLFLIFVKMQLNSVKIIVMAVGIVKMALVNV